MNTSDIEKDYDQTSLEKITLFYPKNQIHVVEKVIAIEHTFVSLIPSYSLLFAYIGMSIEPIELHTKSTKWLRSHLPLKSKEYISCGISVEAFHDQLGDLKIELKAPSMGCLYDRQYSDMPPGKGKALNNLLLREY